MPDGRFQVFISFSMPIYVVNLKAIIVKDGKIMVIKKKRYAHTKSGPISYIDYSLPGGLVYYDESIEDALKREVKTEIGLDIEPLFPIYTTKYVHPTSGHWNIKIDYIVKVKGGEIKLGREFDQEFLEVCWVDENTKDIPDWLKKEVKIIKERLRSLNLENFSSYE